VRDGGFSGPSQTTQEKDARDTVSVRTIDPLNDFFDDRFASAMKTSLVRIKTSTALSVGISIWHFTKIEIHDLTEVN
jgi:hypothetical protein